MEEEEKSQLAQRKAHIEKLRTSCSLVHFPEDEYVFLDKKYIERQMS